MLVLVSSSCCFLCRCGDVFGGALAALAALPSAAAAEAPRFKIVQTLPFCFLARQAEVQQVNSDGGIALHTRSLKYGKVCACVCVCVCMRASVRVSLSIFLCGPTSLPTFVAVVPSLPRFLPRDSRQRTKTQPRIIFLHPLPPLNAPLLETLTGTCLPIYLPTHVSALFFWTPPKQA